MRTEMSAGWASDGTRNHSSSGSRPSDSTVMMPWMS